MVCYVPVTARITVLVTEDITLVAAAATLWHLTSVRLHMQHTHAPHGATLMTQTSRHTRGGSQVNSIHTKCRRTAQSCSTRGPAPAVRSVITRAASLGDEVAASDLVEAGFDYGLSCSQGPREAMEDELCIVEFSHSIYAGAPCDSNV